MKNEMELIFSAMSENEVLSRMVISAFLVRVNPTMSMISEVRTAVSEAVTNSIVHAYSEQKEGKIILRAVLEKDRLLIEIEDFGCGIGDVEQAMKPFYTSQPEKERSGMGFSLMQSFMDSVQVCSVVGKGTTVSMMKLFCGDDLDVL